MKTLKELYEEIKASEELQKEFLSLKTEEIEEFCEKHGCKTTLNEVKRFIHTYVKNDYKSFSQLAGGSKGDSKGDGLIHKSFREIDNDTEYQKFITMGRSYWKCNYCNERLYFISEVEEHMKKNHNIVYDHN